MDAGRFDALSRSLATRRTRRAAFQRFGTGGIAAGLLAALGVERAAATNACSLTITAITALGPHAKTTYDGTLELQIGDQGAIDDGSFATKDGESFPLVGQATGRALEVRITLADKTVLALAGTAELDLVLCRGAVSGTFDGPGEGDLGTWRTVENATTSGSSGGNGGDTGASSGGNASGGSPAGNASGSGNASASGNASGSGGVCPSGVVCGGVCCQPIAGTTPDQIGCDGNSCACTYSCQAAGCPNGGTAHSFNVGCGDRPDALCDENCNVGADNGCSNVMCGPGTTFNPNTCACDSTDAGAACPGTTNCGTAAAPVCADTLTDPSHCGGCEVQCAAGQECAAGACVNPCPAGQKHCSGVCADPKDPICCANGVSCGGVCCQSAQAVCNAEFGDCCESGKLCGGGTVCCQSAGGTCCDTTHSSACCDPGTSCTSDAICCASGVSCGGKCCASAQAVCNAEFGDCCESGKLCGGGTVCCSSADGTCCDVTSPGGGGSSACCVGGTTCNQATGACE